MKAVSRRSFIKNTSGAGLSLWLGFSGVKAGMLKTTDPATIKEFSPFLHVASDGVITFFNPKPEMGQGTLQSIAALVAEELEVSMDQLKIVPTNGEKQFGKGQAVGGSFAVRSSYADMRKVGAAAKEVFIQAAATKWSVDAASCRAENGKVLHDGSGKSATYGELVEEAAKIELPKSPKLKDRKDFKIIGKVNRRPDVPLKVSGKADFGIDAEVPGMLYASVERCPVLGGTLKSFDATAAMKLPGVVKVVEAERVVGSYTSKGVAVIAKTYWAAVQGRKALKLDWDTKGFESFNSSDYEKQLHELAKTDGINDKTIGDPDAATKPGEAIEAFYETPMVAHHTLEVLNAVVHVQGDKLDIWTSTQVPIGITGSRGPVEFSKQVGFAADNITLHNQFIGGGFGRRLYTDYIYEAVTIGKQIDAPVKVIWTREDTTKFGPFRPMTFSAMKGAVSADGKLIHFHHKVISPSMTAFNNPAFKPTDIDRTMVEGIAEQDYEMANLKTSWVRAENHVPIAAWRSVTSSTVAFPHECFIDELAHKAKKDPLKFRMEMLTKDTRSKRLFEKMVKIAEWDKPLPAGKGRGFAQWKFFAGQAAHVVEVTYNKAKNAVKIDRVIALIDIGEVVNPDNVRNQVEGAIIMAISAAIKPGITLEKGVVRQSNFHDNPQLRINETPNIEVHILAEGDALQGVGEPGLPPVAPALCNAIFAASGKRIRKLPFDINNIK